MNIKMNKKTLLAAAIGTLMSVPAMAADSLRMVIEVDATRSGQLKSDLAALGITVNRDLPSLESMAVTLDKSQLKAVSGLGGIKAFYPDVPRELMAEGPLQFVPYGFSMVQADKVRYQGGKKVCVIDSGYNIAHPDLPSANVDGAEDGGAGVWYEDGLGHGTHVAGTIAALDNDHGSVGLVGDQAIDLHIVRVFSGNGSFAYASDLAGAIEDCQAAGSNVISMSLGGKFASPLERRAIDKVARDNILLIAAAGNAGQAAHSYPASYDSVVSVAAVDSVKQHAPFSQRSAQIELSAPGVDVMSTGPMGRGYYNLMNVSQDGINFQGYAMTGSSLGTVTGTLADCGRGTESCGDMTGKICLFERGDVPFFQKVNQCEADGGMGAIVRNNAPGMLVGTIYPSPIVSGSVNYAEGLALMNNLGKETTIAAGSFPNHVYNSGTSMATPHVSGVAAIVWSYFPECSAEGIRLALRASAEDLGTAGYDYEFGWGLVQAKDAVDYISANGCKAPQGKIQGGGSAR